MKVPILLPNIFNYPFTYETNIKLQTGDYVQVPFGKSKITGVVWNDFEKKNDKNFKIKKIIKKYKIPSLNKNTIKFLNWFSQYNMIPKGMALKLALLSSDVVENLPIEEYYLYNNKSNKEKFKLTKIQNENLKKLNNDTEKFRAHVLQGLTGSGKTIVYFESLKKY